MNNVVLYHKTGGLSAPRLAKFLGFDHTKSLSGEEERRPYIIRYGNRKKIPMLPSGRTFNRREMLDRAGTRVRQLERLHSAGVSIPPFWAQGSSVSAPPYDPTVPILARQLGDGQQTFGGAGIEYFPVGKDADGWDLYVQFLPKDRQFRVHVIGHETRTRELIPDEEDAKKKAVWNYGSGFKFKYPPGKDIPHEVVPAAVQAVKALWLDFGAVDVITLDGKAYVLEVNTSPGLSDPTLEWYGEQLGRLVGLTDLPGWDAAGLEKEDE